MSTASGGVHQLDAEAMQRGRDHASSLIHALSIAGSEAWETWTDFAFEEKPCGLACDKTSACAKTVSITFIYRLALSECFDQLLFRLGDVASALEQPMQASRKEGAIASTWIIGDILTKITRFPAYPLERVSRLVNAHLTCILYDISVTIYLVTANGQPPDDYAQRMPLAGLMSVVRTLHRHPNMDIDIDLTVPAFRPNRRQATLRVQRTKRDILLSWLRFMSSIELEDPTALSEAVMVCLALGVQLPSDFAHLELPPTWESSYLVSNTKARLELLDVASYFSDRKAHQVEVCMCCGLFKSLRDQTTARYKSCAGCSLLTYCSKECQKMHWSKGGHREACNKICLKKG